MLHYLMKYQICKNSSVFGKDMNKCLELHFGPSCTTASSSTNTGSISKTKHNLTYRMGQNLTSKLLFISSPNTDGRYRFYILQGSVATQLRCGGMLNNHFITYFLQNAPVKKCWKSVNIWQRYGQQFVACFSGPFCIGLLILRYL